MDRDPTLSPDSASSTEPAATLPETLDQTLQGVIHSAIPDALISNDHKHHIAATVRLLPARITSFFGYECKLQDPTPRADFLLCVYADPGGRILAGLDHPLPEALSAEPVWQRIQAFAGKWMTAGSPLAGNVLNMWLEFDVDGPPPRVALPSVFFKPKGDSVSAGKERRWLFDGLVLLAGRPLSPPVARCVAHCIDALPPGGHAFQVAAMLGRPTEAVRLCIRGLKLPDVSSYLARIGYPGDLQRVEDVLGSVTDLVDGIALSLDAADGVLPTIGLECYVRSREQMLARTWRFLEFLVEQGLCLPAKRDAICSYHGLTSEGPEHKHWPAHLIWESAFVRKDTLSTFWRILHHVKLVLRPKQDLEAKGYLLVNHDWFTPDFLRKLLRLANG